MTFEEAHRRIIDELRAARKTAELMIEAANAPGDAEVARYIKTSLDDFLADLDCVD